MIFAVSFNCKWIWSIKTSGSAQNGGQVEKLLISIFEYVHIYKGGEIIVITVMSNALMLKSKLNPCFCY